MKALLAWLPVVLFTCSIRSTKGYLPVVLLHGIESDNTTLDYLVSRINKEHPGTEIYNLNVYSNLASNVPAFEQIRGKLGEEFVKISNKYPKGFNMLGYSQGGILCRGLIETYCHHNVVHYISLSAPLAGFYYGPLLSNSNSNPDPVVPLVFYNPAVQSIYSLTNYYNDPYEHDVYLKQNPYIPYIDNEIRTNMSECYKKGFTRCERIIMIGGPDDGVVVPWESSHFSYYDKRGKVENFRDRKAYKEDWFGLKTMDYECKLTIHVMSGLSHGDWISNDTVFSNFIIPYLI